MKIKPLSLAWLALAASTPLFSVEFLRMDSAGLRVHIAIPMFLTGLLMALTLSMMMTKTGKLYPAKDKLLLISTWSFLLWHLFGLVPSEDFPLAIREFVKLGLGVCSFWTVAAAFPRRPEFMARFWRVVLWSSALLMGYLIYHYYFVFQSEYLSGNLEEKTKEGKNQLTEYLVYVIPYALSLAMLNRRKSWLHAVPLAVLTTALVYAASRAAWISCLAGVVYVVFLSGGLRDIGRKLRLAAVATVLVLGSFWLLSSTIPNLEAPRRFLYLIDPAAVPELNSYEERNWRIRGGISAFWGSPIMGVGLINTKLQVGSMTHNDYVNILGDLGLVGLALFLMILLGVGIKVFRRDLGRTPHKSWTSMAAKMAFSSIIVSLFFTNSYTTPFLWIFLGLCWVQSDIDAAQASAVEASLASSRPRPAASPR